MIYACSVYGQKQEGLRSLLSQFKKIPPFSIQENPSFLNSRKQKNQILKGESK
jgi:hypothetical protein